ncbi:GGDEF domain-containing protein [Candidatus Dependentiae bacterium]|nr:GGDEF domain-containing protein [Candidatus Dependentiae bacterium]
MYAKIKKSNFLLLILCVLLIISVSNAIYVYLEFTEFKNEAHIVNSAGIIRGNIQRAVKLELQNISENDSIDLVNQFFENFTKKKDNFKVIDKNNIFYQQLRLFNMQWDKLKKNIQKYRDDKTENSKNELIKQSEICWKLSNDLVLTTQLSYEAKLIFFKNLIIIALLVFLSISVVIYVVRNYVQIKLEYMANYDGLTNALNRHAYNIIIENELKKAARNKDKISLIVFDIDHFKKINDTFGHKIGDYILKELVKIVSLSIRKSDYIFRIGGEEFCILASNISFENAIELAEKIRKKIENEKFNDNIKVTISIGLAQSLPEDTASDLFKRADKKLYVAKNSGRNQVQFCKGDD